MIALSTASIVPAWLNAEAWGAPMSEKMRRTLASTPSMCAGTRYVRLIPGLNDRSSTNLNDTFAKASPGGVVAA
jgi:hypothetical protein